MIGTLKEINKMREMRWTRNNFSNSIKDLQAMSPSSILTTSQQIDRDVLPITIPSQLEDDYYSSLDLHTSL